MFVFVLALGGVFAAAGLILIGVSLPISESSLDPAYILPGTIALVGGAILVGLALAMAQLSKIADALKSPLPARAMQAIGVPGEPAAQAQMLESARARTEAPPARAGAPVETAPSV